MNNEAVLTILLMGLVTVVTRLGGLWLMGKIKMSPFVKIWLENLPGALVLAIVAPTILSGNPAEILAAAAVILTMILTRNLLLAMIAGSGIIAVMRNFFV